MYKLLLSFILIATLLSGCVKFVDAEPISDIDMNEWAEDFMSRYDEQPSFQNDNRDEISWQDSVVNYLDREAPQIDISDEADSQFNNKEITLDINAGIVDATELVTPISLYGDKYTWQSNLPRINLDSEDAQRINQLIFEYPSKLEYWNPYATRINMDYETYTSGNVLSIVIVIQWTDVGDYGLVKTFNFNISDGHEITSSVSAVSDTAKIVLDRVQEIETVSMPYEQTNLKWDIDVERTRQVNELLLTSDNANWFLTEDGRLYFYMYLVRQNVDDTMLLMCFAEDGTPYQAIPWDSYTEQELYVGAALVQYINSSTLTSLQDWGQ